MVLLSLTNSVTSANAIIIISKIKKRSFLSVTWYEMPLSLPDPALILKQFHVKSSKSVAAVSEFRRLKGMSTGKGPLTQISMRKMVKKIGED
ncbi:hypothetical protein NPIL_28361 [Nephila pilipes]|uniref:DUF4817 domain-containing protein n=1 Tax=Nephila pilipes TaxID=299642 RepID=A0A8X6N508_NEPPI|nr:hypothetical protein NPIL_28361 [Nephila pilipes]